MQNISTIKNCISIIVYFCVCNFLSIKSIFYTFTYYFLIRFLVTTSVFKRASPIATSSTFELQSHTLISLSLQHLSLEEENSLNLLEPWNKLNTWTWLVLNNHICFVIIKTRNWCLQPWANNHPFLMMTKHTSY